MDFSAKLFITLCMILIFQSPLLTNARVHSLLRLLEGAPGMIGQICQQTTAEDVSNCDKILRTESKIQNAKDYFEISGAIVELGINRATNGQLYFRGLLKTKYSTIIEECADNYGETISWFKSALAEMKDDPLIANYDALVAGDGPENCQSALVAAKIADPTVSALNHETWLLSRIANLALCYLPHRQIHGINL